MASAVIRPAWWCDHLRDQAAMSPAWPVGRRGMATFVCLHGAGGRGSYWDLVGAELTRRGHQVVAPDLPCEQSVGLDAYVDVVVDAVAGGGAGEVDGDDLAGHAGTVLVAQSLAGFVAPLVCARIPVDLMVLVAAMVPKPGESGGDWWAATGHGEAVAAQGLPDDTPETLFTHDVPSDVLAAAGPPRDQAGTLLEEPWPLDAWPDVPTEFLLCREDRFFPAGWLREISRQRLGIEPVEVPGGHCAFLSQPVALGEAILGRWEGHLAARRA
jgi:pimeloyl-ACP methyl ester carboxylesterase